MIVNMSEKATEQEIEHMIERIREAGYQPHVTRGVERTMCACGGKWTPPRNRGVAGGAGWITWLPFAQPFKLVSRQVKPAIGGECGWSLHRWTGSGDIADLVSGISRAVCWIRRMQ